MKPMRGKGERRREGRRDWVRRSGGNVLVVKVFWRVVKVVVVRESDSWGGIIPYEGEG
jgi:hypothetical protein